MGTCAPTSTSRPTSVSTRLQGVGDGAFSTYSPLSGAGTADGISVLVGKRVLEMGFQPTERVKKPSPEFDRIVRFAQGIVKKMRANR